MNLVCAVKTGPAALQRSALDQNRTMASASTDRMALAGGISGIVEGLVVQPLDMIKTRFQLMAAPGVSRPTIGSALHGLIREGGLPRLYRGVVPELAAMTPKASAMYLSYEEARDYVVGIVSQKVQMSKPTPMDVGNVEHQWSGWENEEAELGNSKPKHRWELSVDVGDEFIQNPLSKKGLDTMANNIRKIISRVDAVRAENDYEKEQQNVFQEAGESIMFSIMVLNILMIIVMSFGMISSHWPAFNQELLSNSIP